MCPGVGGRVQCGGERYAGVGSPFPPVALRDQILTLTLDRKYLYRSKIRIVGSFVWCRETGLARKGQPGSRASVTDLPALELTGASGGGGLGAEGKAPSA